MFQRVKMRWSHPYRAFRRTA